MVVVVEGVQMVQFFELKGAVDEVGFQLEKEMVGVEVVVVFWLVIEIQSLAQI